MIQGKILRKYIQSTSINPILGVTDLTGYEANGIYNTF